MIKPIIALSYYYNLLFPGFTELKTVFVGAYCFFIYHI